MTEVRRCRHWQLAIVVVLYLWPLLVSLQYTCHLYVFAEQSFRFSDVSCECSDFITTCTHERLFASSQFSHHQQRNNTQLPFQFICNNDYRFSQKQQEAESSSSNGSSNPSSNASSSDSTPRADRADPSPRAT